MEFLNSLLVLFYQNVFISHSSARMNDHSPNVTQKIIGSHRICMGFEVSRKRDDISRVFRVLRSKKRNLSYLSRVQCSREYSSRVSIRENRLKFWLLLVLFFFFDETVLPLLLLSSYEDV